VTDERRERRARSFGAQAQAYERGRPGYPTAAVRLCLPDGARRALDLGAGTGKLTRALLGEGLAVAALEPLDEMRAQLPAEAEAVDAHAESLPFDGGSFDAVVAGQAWHWFDRDRVLPEVVRVLRPGGRLGLLWNIFDDSVDWVARVCDAFGAEDRVRNTDANVPWRDAAGLSDPVKHVVRHSQPADADTLVANITSRSNVIIATDAERARIVEAVRDAAPPGDFEVPYLCEVWVGSALG
jgi:SAM-dependent methyltransferase